MTIEITRPLLTLADEAHDPIDGVTRSRDLVEMMEKASMQGTGTYYALTPDGGIASRFDIKDGSPPSDTDPDPDPEPDPDPDPEPVPDPDPDPDPGPFPDPVVDIASLLPSIRDIGTITTGQNNPVIIDGRAGDRHEVGLFTEWQSEYLATGRNRDLIIRQADENLGLPWCDYTKMLTKPWMEGEGYNFSFAHTPNLFFLPYLITGDTKYVAPMECQYKIYSKWRQVTPESGIKWLTGRDMAWQLRNLAQLAYIQKLGGTQETYYVDALELTRQRIVSHMEWPIEKEFHTLGENQMASETSWTGWFESFLGMTTNLILYLGFEEWRGVVEWHFRHLEMRSGERWPVKAVDCDHIAPKATWEETAAVNESRMENYLSAPDDKLMPTKMNGIRMTYADRAAAARSWAAMAAHNNVPGGSALFDKLDALIKERGDGAWYKYSILPGAVSAEDDAGEVM